MDKETIVKEMGDALQEAILQIDPQISLTSKQMFGGAGFWADGVIFAAWFGNTLALKLDEDARRDLLELPEARTSDYMKAYIETPPEFLNDGDVLAQWVEKSLTYIRKNRKKSR
ncbi:MAG: TfoX/Sxy family protein [Aggregatilineales bacterium]